MSVSDWLSQTSPYPPTLAADPPIVLAARISPFTTEELESAWTDWSSYSLVLADVMLVLARTGLRWNELRELRVSESGTDFLTVRGSRARHVPVVARVRPIVERLLAGRDGDERLFTTNLGTPLNRPAVLSRLHWPETGRGRRLVDLRHTAAHLWLAEGACPDAVREWMGGR